MGKKSTEYLSYIEETRKHHSKIAEIAAESSKTAVDEAFSKNETITILKGEEIVQISEEGDERVIATYPNHRRKSSCWQQKHLI